MCLSYHTYIFLKPQGYYTIVKFQTILNICKFITLKKDIQLNVIVDKNITISRLGKIYFI